MQWMSPNVLQFIGGTVSMLIGVLVLKQDANSLMVGGGALAMANALKSAGDAYKGAQEKAAAKRASMAPPAP